MFETEKPKFNGHMINWSSVRNDMAPIVPKDKNGVYIFIPGQEFISILGDDGPVMPIEYYPYRIIPVYL